MPVITGVAASRAAIRAELMGPDGAVDTSYIHRARADGSWELSLTATDLSPAAVFWRITEGAEAPVDVDVPTGRQRTLAECPSAALDARVFQVAADVDAAIAVQAAADAAAYQPAFVVSALLGDGVTDASSGIQAKVDAAFAAGGGEVYIPAVSAYYKIVTEIDVKTGVTLTGAGVGSLLQKDALDNNDVVVVTNATDVVIRNLHVRNSSQVAGDSAFGIRVTGATTERVHVHHCIVANSWLGIGVLDVTGPASASRVTVADNFIYDIGNNGVGVNSLGEQIIVARNTITNFGTQSNAIDGLAAGVEFRGGSYGQVVDNNISGGLYGAGEDVDGLRIEYDTTNSAPATHTIVTGNVIKDVRGFGIRFQWCRAANVSNNLIEGAASTGIFVFSEVDVLAEVDLSQFNNNTILGCGRGMSFQGEGAYPVKFCQANNNVIDGGDHGIYLTAPCEHNLFANNTITGTTGPGIYVLDGDFNTFDGCRVIDCGTAGGTYGILCAAGDTNKFIDCEAYETGTAVNVYSIRLAGLSTYVSGGYYGAGTTGTIDDASTNSLIFGVAPTAGDGVRSSRFLLAGPLSIARRGFGAQVTIKAPAAGQEGLYVERFSAGQTAAIFVISDENGNARTYVGADLSFRTDGAIHHTGTTVGFNSATPVGKRTLGAAATDAASTQALANNLRQALIDLGLGQT